MPLLSFLRRLRRGAPVVVVSGLPRSGTSMMMRMLAAGGMPLLTDDLRAADGNNPHGYFEFEPVKRLAEGSASDWLDLAQGRAVKIVSLLLTWLPETHDYRVIFMRRDLGEVTASQQSMLGESGDTAQLAGYYQQHLADVGRFLARRKCFSVLDVEHRRVLQEPAAEARRIAAFLERPLNVGAMAAAVDPRLYRHKDA
jgi:hypothetical protein